MAKQIAKLKKKKKKWVPIHASDFFGQKLIGEVPVYETQQTLGKVITINFVNLTGDMKKQHINVSFKVNDIKEGRAISDLVRYHIIPSSLRRFVRKGREKIDDSFVVKTKDEKFVRIKPMLVTNSSTHSSVVTNLRNTTRKLVQNVVITYTYSQLVEEVVNYKLQKYLRDILHKTYPIKVCEIRDFVLLEKAPLHFNLQTEDVSEIIKKSRTAKKGTGEPKKKKDEDEEGTEEPESAPEDTEKQE